MTFDVILRMITFPSNLSVRLFKNFLVSIETKSRQLVVARS